MWSPMVEIRLATVKYASELQLLLQVVSLIRQYSTSPTTRQHKKDQKSTIALQWLADRLRRALESRHRLRINSGLPPAKLPLLRILPTVPPLKLSTAARVTIVLHVARDCATSARLLRTKIASLVGRTIWSVTVKAGSNWIRRDSRTAWSTRWPRVRQLLWPQMQILPAPAMERTLAMIQHQWQLMDMLRMTRTSRLCKSRYRRARSRLSTTFSKRFSIKVW